MYCQAMLRPTPGILSCTSTSRSLICGHPPQQVVSNTLSRIRKYLCREVNPRNLDRPQNLPRETDGFHLVCISVRVITMGFPSFKSLVEVARLDNHAAQGKYIAPAVAIFVDPIAFGAALEHGRPVIFGLWCRAVYVLSVGCEIGGAGGVSSI